MLSKIFEDIAIGDCATITRVVTPDDLYVFAHVSGDLNPIHLKGVISEKNDRHPAPSMWLGSLFSAILGNCLPGPGTLYQSQTLRFSARAYVGDTLTITVRVTGKRPPNTILLHTSLSRDDTILVDGEAEILAPEERLPLLQTALPQLTLARHRHADRLLAVCQTLPPLTTAVIAPEGVEALNGAIMAAKAGLITPVLVGSAQRIRALALQHRLSLEDMAIEDIDDPNMAVARAVAMVHEGRVAALMKGHLHTDELLKAVLKSPGGLRGTRRLSHAFVMDAPSLPDLLMVTDAAINIAPSLEDKVDIVQNAIDLAQALGLRQPKVGILSAIELVNPKIPSTLDAAILSKMAERGQIRGGLVDGPLAMDNAISLTAARTKGLTSLVAGRADILIAPNLEAGNILAKELTYLAQAEGAGLVLGALAPIMLTSRADDERARLFSCAVALLYAHWRKTGCSAVPPRGDTSNTVPPRGDISNSVAPRGDAGDAA